MRLKAEFLILRKDLMNIISTTDSLNERLLGFSKNEHLKAIILVVPTIAMFSIVICQLSSRNSYALFLSGWLISLLIKNTQVKTVAHVIYKKPLAAILTLSLTFTKT